jgi:hypothetical protein
MPGRTGYGPLLQIAKPRCSLVSCHSQWRALQGVRFACNLQCWVQTADTILASSCCIHRLSWYNIRLHCYLTNRRVPWVLCMALRLNCLSRFSVNVTSFKITAKENDDVSSNTRVYSCKGSHAVPMCFQCHLLGKPILPLFVESSVVPEQAPRRVKQILFPEWTVQMTGLKCKALSGDPRLVAASSYGCYCFVNGQCHWYFSARGSNKASKNHNFTLRQVIRGCIQKFPDWAIMK